ncbi:MAG: MFS transporter [Planctomycetales bacterium]|nr:MFS transporter [Planctomycetales bacterium]
MFVHLSGFLERLGASEALIGVIIGSMSVSAIAIRPLLGAGMDIHGRRLIVIVGGAFNLLACAGYLFVDAIGPLVFFIRVLHGIGEASLFSVLFTIAADVVPAHRRAQGLAIFGVSGLLSLSLGGLLGDWILAHYDYRTMFGVSTAISALALLVAIPLPETKPELLPGQLARQSIFAVAVQPSLLPLWVLTFGFTIGITSYFTFIKTFIAARAVGSVGGFFAAYSIASVALRLLFSWVPERFGLKRVLLPAIGSLAIGLMMLAFAQEASMVVAAGAACGIGHGYVFPIASAMVVTRARAQSRGLAMTLFTALFDFGALIGGPLLGLTAEHFGYRPMFNAAAIFVVLLTVWFYAIDRRVVGEPLAGND